MAKADKIKLHHYEDAEQIANTITEDEIEDCIDRIRSRMCDT